MSLDLSLCGQSIWRNSSPSSTRFCRPIRLQYMRETFENSKLEKEYYDKLISNLCEYTINYEKDGLFYNLRFKFSLNFTMVDGKVISAVLGVKSAQTCNVCLANPTEMNNLERIYSRETNDLSLLFGLSPLHGWMRIFEGLINVSYRIPIGKWRIYKKNKDEYETFCKRKIEIQRKFKKYMGLLIDIPKAGGSGTSTDGNTARRAFHAPKFFSKITGNY